MTHEEVVDYFLSVVAASDEAAAANEGSLHTVLEHVHNYVGGHIHPLSGYMFDCWISVF